MQHRHHRRWIHQATVLVGAFTMAALAGCSTFGPRVHEQRTMTVAHAAGISLSIVTANGSVLAERQRRSDVLVEVDLFGPDAERLSFTNVHAERVGDGSLRVWIDWPGGKRKYNEGANIDVLLPDAVGVDVRTSNGTVTLIGLAGLAKINTSNGNVTVLDHSGAVHADTSNGNLRLEGVDGDIVAGSSNGAITITEAFGSVEADTSNGNAYVSTAHGNPGPVRILTSNGRVQLELGDGFAGILRVKTSNGKVAASGFDNARLIDYGKNTLKMQIGTDETISAVRTSNGSVRISPRDE